jgi:hypothetical protein
MRRSPREVAAARGERRSSCGAKRDEEMDAAPGSAFPRHPAPAPRRMEVIELDTYHGSIYLAARTNHREFHRVETEIAVRYRFLPAASGVECPGPESFEGRTANLSAGGLLLEGRVPDDGIIGDLIMGRVLVGLELGLPGEGGERVLKTIGRVAWMEGLEHGLEGVLIGLHFDEITAEDRERLVEFVIRNTV